MLYHAATSVSLKISSNVIYRNRSSIQMFFAFSDKLSGCFESFESFQSDTPLDWLTDDCQVHGFHWRAGAKRDTVGIWVWGEPIMIEAASGEMYAVLLVQCLRHCSPPSHRLRFLFTRRVSDGHAGNLRQLVHLPAVPHHLRSVHHR